MNITRFKHLLAVVDEGGFGRAAARLGIKQPPLSQSIARLERDLGMTLLERVHGGVKLTKAGIAFVPEARAAVAATERAVAATRVAGSRSALVRVGVVSVALWEALPRLLGSARKARIAVQLVQTSTNEQLHALAHGSLDLGLVAPPFDAPARMRTLLLTNEPVVLAVPAVTKATAVDELLTRVCQRLILFPRADGPTLYDAVLRMFSMLGHQPEVVQESARMLTTLALVGAGIGTAIVPAVVARHVTVKGVVFRSLEGLPAAPTWPLALAHMPLSARSEAARLLSLMKREPQS
jgi:DNA-binding transcriptional LysR family regulator